MGAEQSSNYPRISTEHYERIREKLIELSGINLGENKVSLVEARLYKRLSELRIPDYGTYLRYLDTNVQEVGAFLNSLTTNKTDWFREPRHFKYLQQEVLPQYSRGDRSSRLLFWSAASSTGEEAYSLGMFLRENLAQNMDYKILGTDIDTEVLARAKVGAYSPRLVREQVPPQLVQKYFIEAVQQGEKALRISPEIASNVKFREFNLVEGQLPVQMGFDVIFLRNVLIYFSRPTIERVIHGISRYLKPGGYLFIGHSETLNNISHPLVQVSEAVYRQKG